MRRTPWRGAAIASQITPICATSGEPTNTSEAAPNRYLSPGRSAPITRSDPFAGPACRSPDAATCPAWTPGTVQRGRCWLYRRDRDRRGQRRVARARGSDEGIGLLRSPTNEHNEPEEVQWAHVFDAQRDRRAGG